MNKLLKEFSNTEGEVDKDLDRVEKQRKCQCKYTDTVEGREAKQKCQYKMAKQLRTRTDMRDKGSGYTETVKDRDEEQNKCQFKMAK